jgi:hypothetical protein
MGWLPWLKRRANHDRVHWGDDSFLGSEWNEYFRTLTPGRRRAAALAVCHKALAAVSLHGEDVGQALAALELGSTEPDVVRAIGSLVDRLEGEYDSLVGDDEEKLACTDPVIRAAFDRARAATALKNALEGDLSEMVYEAWFALDCRLDAMRRLVGMPRPKR